MLCSYYTLSKSRKRLFRRRKRLAAPEITGLRLTGIGGLFSDGLYHWLPRAEREQRTNRPTARLLLTENKTHLLLDLAGSHEVFFVGRIIVRTIAACGDSAREEFYGLPGPIS